jgi:hypothetical protein
MEEYIDPSSENTKAEDFPGSVLYWENPLRTLKSDKNNGYFT